MSVWVAFPTCNAERARAAIAAWSEQGYHVAILTDDRDATGYATRDMPDLHIHVDAYPGYFRSVNALAKAILAVDPKASCVVAAADDMLPDQNMRAEEIAEEYIERFPLGYGVMQPWGDTLEGTDRIAGSPWFGRAWIKQAYRGEGPLCPEYSAFYGDEELLNVAQKLGVFWGRRDLTQEHHHWVRYGRETKTDYQQRNSDKYFASDRRTFNRRVAEGRGA